jgi:Predicted nucleic acid-binding protein, consists of a PIN domain and a Zn-ribbon module
MEFCTGCGRKLPDKAKFCPACGKHTQKAQPDDGSRKIEYAGKIVKCPACGTELPSLTGICPGCGHEINTQKISDSLRLFIIQINDCDRQIANSPEAPKKGWATWSKGMRIGWILLNIQLVCIPLLIYYMQPMTLLGKPPQLSTIEKHKAVIIENFTLPNDRGPILEALLFIKSKVNYLANEKPTSGTAYWTRLWTNKAEELYRKAEVLYPNDKISNEAYRDIIASSQRAKKALNVRRGIVIAIVAAPILINSI